MGVFYNDRERRGWRRSRGCRPGAGCSWGERFRPWS